VNGDVEKEFRRPHPEKMLQNHEVAGTRDRQELGQTLNGAQDQGINRLHVSSSLAFIGTGSGA
jgi:hypothetical protein